MENLKNTTSKAVKKENSTKKVLNQIEGITLVALVITVIVMLILAGVSISALMENEGLFARTASAADAYKQATQKENDNIQDLLNELDTIFDEVASKNPGKDEGHGENETFKDPKEVAKLGDWVNYSVEVDGEVYDGWRILNFDNNGHMEIVCCTGPAFDLISGNDPKEVFLQAIKRLNDATTPFKEGKYGESARCLGSDPSNPKKYEIIDERYVKYYDVDGIGATEMFSKENEAYPYVIQEHFQSDLDAINSFGDTDFYYASDADEHLGFLLAARCACALNDYTAFSVFNTYYIGNGKLVGRPLTNLVLPPYDNNGAVGFYNVNSDGTIVSANGSLLLTLLPVVSLESGVKIDTSLEGDGTSAHPWQLAK